MFSFAKAVGSCITTSDEVIEEGKGKISKFIEMVEGALDRKHVTNVKKIDHQLAYLDDVLERCSAMKEKLLMALEVKNNAESTRRTSATVPARMTRLGFVMLCLMPSRIRMAFWNSMSRPVKMKSSWKSRSAQWRETTPFATSTSTAQTTRFLM